MRTLPVFGIEGQQPRPYSTCQVCSAMCIQLFSINMLRLRYKKKLSRKTMEGEGMKNLDIRITVAGEGLKYTQIADVMGITPVYLSRIMAKELKPSMRTRILNAIDELEQTAEKKGKESVVSP